MRSPPDWQRIEENGRGMNGVHDMGGMQGFGPVSPEPDEPVFHTDWEARCLALNRAMGYAGAWKIDVSRAAIEQMPAHLYLTMTYYEKWAYRMEKLLLKRGLLTPDEVAAGRALGPAQPLPRKLTAADVPKALTRASYERPAPAPARFTVGDRVRTSNNHPRTHTRLPRYARGRCGVIETVRGCQVFPDSVAIGAGEDPQWLYTVCFEGRELWGDTAEPTLRISIDAWEPYLEPA
jgi:nitrile hydratase beta subunit